MKKSKRKYREKESTQKNEKRKNEANERKSNTKETEMKRNTWGKRCEKILKGFREERKKRNTIVRKERKEREK